MLYLSLEASKNMTASKRAKKFTFATAFILVLLCLPVFAGALAITSAQLIISADDCFTAYIDGCLVYDTGKITSNSPWDVTFTQDVTGCLTKCGPHVLAINYYDTEGSVCRVTYKLLITMDNGNSVVAYSDGNTTNIRQMSDGNIFSTSNAQFFPTGWNTLAYDDTSWTETAYTCQANGNTDDSIADPVFNGPTYNGFVPYMSYNSGCSAITTGDSNLVRQYFTTPCAPVSITKTISATNVSLGQTITYCFDYHNYDTIPVTFGIWDTIPAVTDFVGCDSGCSTTTYGSNVVVSWSVTVPSNTTGAVCFWVAANRFPMKNGAEKFLAMIGDTFNAITGKKPQGYVDKND
jgi:hypothetical protein